ncbi:MAG TPA: YebC/PmpR family DNA-binding transcriptional regulator [Planctomycetota bacterium]|jgi:YebC/PmpR family DNA-binding regulatory protein|nr:YebC/PmpR family DNA-binding transcriptional regulator [Planctomycetota bacterium]
MAGHSHSSNIAARKGAVDQKRARHFNKLARNIMSAVRQGGSDPDHNLKLKYALEKARAGNMPRDNIDRVIKRAAGEKGGPGFEEIVYEGYAPGGVAVMVACLTDNRARTAPDVRYAFDRHGGTIGSPGSVSFLFSFKAIFAAEKGERDEDAWTEVALDAGAEDVRIEGDAVTILAPPADFLAAKQKLEASGAKLFSAELGWMPGSNVAIADKETARKVLALIDSLEEHDDVQNVYANYEIPDDWVRELQA